MQYINNYYMSRQLEQEPEFISQCMENLSAAAKELHSSQESTLLCIQRALLLLKTHLETFKKRYIFCFKTRFSEMFEYHTGILHSDSQGLHTT